MYFRLKNYMKPKIGTYIFKFSPIGAVFIKLFLKSEWYLGTEFKIKKKTS